MGEWVIPLRLLRLLEHLTVLINVAGPEDKGVLEEGKMKILKMKISNH